MSMLRLWMAATAILLTGLVVWAFAPVLVFVLLLTVVLGLVCAVMISLARALDS
jgi:hypothetical protein